MLGTIAPLPLQPTPLIGRDADLATACARLAAGDVRLLTFVGPPGVGKTRLAVAVAERAAEAAGEVAVFVDLALLSDPALFPAAIAHGLGIHDAGEPWSAARLASALAGRPVLLVLDTFEHVLAAAPAIADLLTVSPALRVLATSRAPLGLRWEHQYAVHPLIPRAATELFNERARAAVPDVRLSDADTDVAAICARLDGLPLAIELAAARTRLLPPRTLLNALDDALEVLMDGARDMPPRHRTLRSAIAWSYDLLSEDERALLRRLAVFAGPCTLEDAGAVCDPDGELGVTPLQGATALIGAGLLRASPGPDGAPRVAMLETIRAFAAERLVYSGEASALRDRLAGAMLDRARQSDSHLRRTDAPAWFTRSDADWGIITGVFQDCIEQGAVATGAELAHTLSLYWSRRGRVAEPRRWVEALLTLPGADGRTRSRALLLLVGGQLAFVQGDDSLACVRLEEAVMLARALDDRALVAEALRWRGGLQGHRRRTQGASPDPAPLFEESAALCRAAGDRWGVAAALVGLGDAAAGRGDDAAAYLLHEESLALFRAHGDGWRAGGVTKQLAALAARRDDLDRARTLYEEAVVALSDAGPSLTAAEALVELALVLNRRGEHAAAAARLVESLAISRRLGATERVASALEVLAGAARLAGLPTPAARFYGTAATLREAYDAPRPAAFDALYRAGLERTRATLGDVTFDAAWAAGRASSLDAAIAEGEALAARLARPARRTTGATGDDHALDCDGLTARELQVLCLLAGGRSSREIADALVVSVRTVEHHVARLYPKIGARNRADAARYALLHGLVPNEPPAQYPDPPVPSASGNGAP